MPVTEPAHVLLVTAAATAVVGAVVAWLAYRGYRRNDSQAMRFLAVGLVGITVVPFFLNYGIAPVVGVSDATTLLAVLLANIAGLVSLLYSLDGT
jgi:uncharacterized membrane protein (DUF441 family)